MVSVRTFVPRCSEETHSRGNETDDMRKVRRGSIILKSR